MEPLRQLLAARPADPELNYLYGTALNRIGEFGAATFPLRQAIEDPEWRRAAAFELIQPGLGGHDFNEVVELTTRLIEDDPDDAMALLFRAQAQAWWMKDLPSAVEDARRVLELEPDRLEAYEPLVMALLRLDQHPEARKELAEAGRRLRESDAPEGLLAWHCSTTAIFAFEGGEREEALEKWNACLEDYPMDPTVVTNAVEFFDGQGERDRSLAILKRAHEETEQAQLFRLRLAGRLAASGALEEAEGLLEEATRAKDPHRAFVAWSELAQFRHSLRQHAAAAEALERAILRLEEVEEPDSQLLFRWADALVISDQLDRAEEVAGRIPVAAQRSLILGRIAQQRSDPVAALEHFDEALSVWPNNPWARYYTALAAEQIGDFDRAIEEYRYAIRIDPAATDSRTRAAKLLTAEGRVQRAYQILFIDVGRAPLDPDGKIFSMYLLARAANPNQLQDALRKLAQNDPSKLPEALASGARGAAEMAGPREGLNLLRDAPGIDYTDPSAAPAFRELVRFAHAVGEAKLASNLIEAALKAHPSNPALLEIRGYHLELSGEFAAAHEIYEAVLEARPARAVALRGLGRLALRDRDANAAAQYFDQAYAVDSSDPGPLLGVARILIGADQHDLAKQRLEAVLMKHPFEAEAAGMLAALDLRSGEVTPTTLDRAKRSARFGKAAENFDLLAKVYTRLGNDKKAAQAVERGEQLREREAQRQEARVASPQG